MDKIKGISPRYAAQFEELIKRYSQFGGGSLDDQYGRGRFFSNVYEFYMYAYFVGVKTDTAFELTYDLKLSKFWDIANWKPVHLVDQMIAVAMSRSGFRMFDAQLLDESDLDLEVKKIKNEIEVYANGGFSYILRSIDEHEDEMLPHDFFVNILVSSN